MVSGGNDGNVVVFNRATSKIAASLVGHSARVNSVCCAVACLCAVHVVFRWFKLCRFVRRAGCACKRRRCRVWYRTLAVTTVRNLAPDLCKGSADRTARIWARAANVRADVVSSRRVASSRRESALRIGSHFSSCRALITKNTKSRFTAMKYAKCFQNSVCVFNFFANR